MQTENPQEFSKSFAVMNLDDRVKLLKTITRSFFDATPIGFTRLDNQKAYVCFSMDGVFNDDNGFKIHLSIPEEKVPEIYSILCNLAINEIPKDLLTFKVYVGDKSEQGWHPGFVIYPVVKPEDTDDQLSTITLITRRLVEKLKEKNLLNFPEEITPRFSLPVAGTCISIAQGSGAKKLKDLSYYGQFSDKSKGAAQEKYLHRLENLENLVNG